MTLLFQGAYDPQIDRAPASGMAVGVGVQRVQDDFGLHLELSSPRFLDDHLSIMLAGGIGWYPDLRALPESPEEQSSGAWSLFGHGRLLIKASAHIAQSTGRLYAALGPSALLLSESISTTRFAIGVYGVVGVELFAGDAYQSYPFSFYAELGGAAHTAKADVVNRIGSIEETDTTVDRRISTGFVIGGGVRLYLW